MLGGLLQSFQQCVERLTSQHVNFVNDVDFVSGSTGTNIGVGTKQPDFVDTPVAGTVNFQNIHVFTDRNGLTDVAFIAWCDRQAFIAIQALGKDSCRRSLAHTPSTGEQVGMPDSILQDGIGQCLGDMALSYQVDKRLRAITPGNNRVLRLVRGIHRLTGDS